MDVAHPAPASSKHNEAPGPTAETVPEMTQSLLASVASGTEDKLEERKDEPHGEGGSQGSVPVPRVNSGMAALSKPDAGLDSPDGGLLSVFDLLFDKFAALYLASKDTPERLEQHRARMSFFNGSSDRTDVRVDPDFNPLYTIWEGWATTVQYIHSNDLALLAAQPESQTRDRLRESTKFLYSFAVPSRQVLEYMVKRAPDGRIVEVGAGSGYWASLLQKLGADVVAVDNGREVFDRSYFPACKKQDGAEFLASGEPEADRHGRALFLCWPRMKSQDSAAATFLENYIGDTIFYVGEENGATFCMMDWLEEHKEEGWVLEETIPIPTWPGLHDTFMCFSKAKPSDSGAGHVE